RLCRREGTKLFLKGDKCVTKCVLDKRKEAPGQHSKARRPRKPSEYQKRLREKQKLRRMISVGERPFRRYFDWAQRRPGLTGENLLRFLEMRLDNVVQRMGFAASKVAARQMVLHGHLLVNGRPVNIPSYSLKPGDTVVLKEKSRANAHFQKWWGRSQESASRPSWLETQSQEFAGKVKSWPMRDEISFPVNEQLIVELYSK
ncbi:MAG: 30S ribosomal protein S4, partial [Elusimicrobia bacterium RIFCSPLOWO2_01_FULL_64_13]